MARKFLTLGSRWLGSALAVATLSTASPLAAQSMDLVESALRNENFAEANRAFEALEAAGAATSDDYRAMATRLFRMDRGDDALAVLQRGVVAFPDATRFHYMIATLHRNAGRCSEAIRPFERFLEAQGDDPDAWSGVARCYERVGRMADAIAAWERYLAVEQRDDRAELRAEAAASLEMLRNPGASAAAAQSADPAPLANANGDAIETDARASQSSAAATVSAPAASPATIAQPAGSPFADINAPTPLGVIQMTAPAVREAASSMSTSASTYPDAASALAAGDVSAEARDWNAARSAWVAATQLDATNVEAWYRAGVGAAIAGDAEFAAVAFRQAQALAPDFALAAARAAQADARAEHEATIALDRRGWHTDNTVRQSVAAESFAAGRWLDGVRAQLASDAEIDPLVVALRARSEGRSDELADAAVRSLTVRPDDAARFVEAADSLRLAGDSDAARYLLELYQRMGGETSDRMIAIRAAIERSERR